MAEQASPRIYCIPASDAPVVAVLRRGPSAWWHVGRWDLRGPRYEPGAWLRGRLYPRRSDLSPDGRWLCYFALKSGARWSVGETYCAVSRLPWLTALAAWGSCGTWTRGYYFAGERSNADVGPPENGDASALCARYGLAAAKPEQFGAERRRGFRETSDCPPRDPRDAWDQRRNARLGKPQPGGALTLGVESVGWPGGAFDRHAIDGLEVRYWLEGAGDLQALDDVQWADWTRDGRLIVATRVGRLQIRTLRGFAAETVFEEDLSALEPRPAAPPAWAGEW